MTDKSQPRTVPKWLRVLIPSSLFIIWFALAGIGGPYFGKISDVASNDQSTFLPQSAESTQVQNEITKFRETKTIPAILVFSDDGKVIAPSTIADVKQAVAPLTELDGVVEVSPPIVSEDNRAILVAVGAESDVKYKELLPKIHKQIDSSNLAVNMQITGPLGFLSDLAKAFSGIDGLLLGVALVVVFIILLIVYRAPILPFIVLFTALSALTVSILLVYYLAKVDLVTLNGQVQGILFILVIGAATDYSLLFVARYREELTRHKRTYQAILAAWKRSFEPIVAAGGTVIAGLMCLLLSDLASNKALGPVGSLGILMAIIAALTLLPSILMAFGRVAFWPRQPLYIADSNNNDVPAKGVWPATGRLVTKHHRAIWITTTLVLSACVLGLFSLKADGVPQSDLILGKSEARDGQKVLDKHFAGGSGTPTYAIIPQKSLNEAVKMLDEQEGVSAVGVTATGVPNNTLPVGESQKDLPLFLRLQARPTVTDGEILLSITLTDSPDSVAAQTTVANLRTKLHEISDAARVGGTTAIQLDTNTAARHDRNLIIPVVLVVITLILMVLLRSILAPIILLFTTVLSFAAMLGVASLVFTHVFQFPGADPSVVLYGFTFLVALGIDYNIFLMTRVREESLQLGTRRGVIVGLVVTGGVITSAGIVLAATFAALAVIPILFLAQLAFIVALGVLLDTIVVRSLLVPSIIYDLGKRAWWPASKPNK